MRIGLLVLAAGRGAGGPETYELELVRALARADHETSYRVYCTSPEAARAFGIEAPNLSFHVLRPRSRWVSLFVTLPVRLVRDRIDLLHATYTPPPLATRPYVFTHHDNSPFDHPEYYNRVVLARLRPLVRLGLARASHVVCPSEYTRQVTAERFGTPLQRITAIPHGVDGRFRPADPIVARQLLEGRYGVRAPYFLWVGKLQRSKNTPRLLEAYARVHERLPNGPGLVLVGKRTEADLELDARIARLGLRGRVQELGYVRQEDLPLLYSAARALVFPSVYEGFGLPVIEAMACGTPVITSTVCSLPEVAGQSALLVDPLSVEAIAEAMLQLATDEVLAARLVRLGQDRARQFSWPDHARRVLEVYRGVYQGSLRKGGGPPGEPAAGGGLR